MTLKTEYHLVQRQQKMALVKLLDTTSEDTYITLNTFSMTGKKEVSRNLLSNAGNFPRFTCANRRLKVPSETFNCICT